MNSCIQHLVQNKWDVAAHGRDLSPENNTMAIAGIPALNQSWRGYNHWISHTKATEAHISSWTPPTFCNHCGHMLLGCAVFQESRDEYCTADSLNTLFETVPETCLVELRQEVEFFCRVWMIRYSIQFLRYIVWICTDHRFSLFYSYRYFYRWDYILSSPVDSTENMLSENSQ